MYTSVWQCTGIQLVVYKNGMSRDSRNQIVRANVKVKYIVPDLVPCLTWCPGQNLHKMPTNGEKMEKRTFAETPFYV